MTMAARERVDVVLIFVEVHVKLSPGNLEKVDSFLLEFMECILVLVLF